MKNWITIVELSGFISDVSSLLTAEEHENLVESLATAPEQGEVMPGTGA